MGAWLVFRARIVGRNVILFIVFIIFFFSTDGRPEPITAAVRTRSVRQCRGRQNGSLSLWDGAKTARLELIVLEFCTAHGTLCTYELRTFTVGTAARGTGVFETTSYSFCFVLFFSFWSNPLYLAAGRRS